MMNLSNWQGEWGKGWEAAGFIFGSHDLELIVGQSREGRFSVHLKLLNWVSDERFMYRLSIVSP